MAILCCVAQKAASAAQAPEYPIRTISNFFENSWDICEWMFISGVNDTGEKREKFWDKFFKNILFRA